MDIGYLTSSSRNGMCSCNEVYFAHKIPTDFIRAPLSATLSTAILSKQLCPYSPSFVLKYLMKEIKNLLSKNGRIMYCTKIKKIDE